MPILQEGAAYDICKYALWSSQARRVSVKQRAGVKLSSVKSKSDNMWALKYPFNPKNEKWPWGEKASSPSIDFEGNQAKQSNLIYVQIKKLKRFLDRK